MTRSKTRRELRKPRSDDRLFYDLQAGLFGGQAFVVAYDSATGAWSAPENPPDGQPSAASRRFSSSLSMLS